MIYLLNLQIFGDTIEGRIFTVFPDLLTLQTVVGMIPWQTSQAWRIEVAVVENE